MSNVAEWAAGEPVSLRGPTPKVDVDGHTAERACLNCGTVLVGSHCHGCGQAAHVHRTLAAFFHDLLHGVFHFEGRIWRTLPLLAWRPGRLTREYIDGRRANYVSPIALFLFVVFLTFAVFNALGGDRLDDGIRFDAGRGAAAAHAEMDRLIAELRQRRGEALKSGRRTEPIDKEIAEAERNLKLLEQVTASAPSTAELRLQGNNVLTRTLTAGWRKAKANPALLVYKLQSNAYKFSWLLIPLSVPFLWLLFPFSRRFHIYDHTIFATYSISAMLILTALFSVVAVYDLGALVLLPLLYAPFHMYRQLKETYALSRLGALWRAGAMLMFAAMVLGLFGSVLIALATSG
jgi:hypothetical protein